MSRAFKTFSTIFLIILAIISLGGLVWVNTLYSRDHPGEKDFFIPWLAARTFLQYGDSPYSEPATQRLQVVYYGHLATENQDPLRLSLPFPVELFYFPFALVSDYSLARGLWMTCLEIALVALAFLALKLTDWKPGRTLFTVIVIFSILWVYGFIPLINGRAVIIVAVGTAALLIALRGGRDELAGALLVLPFFKFDIFSPFLLFIVFWGIYNRRGRFLAGFLMTLVLLLAISFFILSNWFIPFLRGWISHFNYQPGITPAAIFTHWWPVLGPRLGLVLTGIILVLLFVEWRKVLRKDFRHLLWTVCLTIAVTPLIGIPVHPVDYVVLFIPFILFLSILNERWSRPGRWGVAGYLTLVVLFGTWLLHAGSVNSGLLNVKDGGQALVLPVLLVLGLYWMRWWAVRPPRTWSDNLT